MIRFVTHEPLASGYFNRNFNAGTGVFSPWEGSLINNTDLVMLALSRMEKDWDDAPAKLRKPYQCKDIEPYIKYNFV